MLISEKEKEAIKLICENNWGIANPDNGKQIFIQDGKYCTMDLADEDEDSFYEFDLFDEALKDFTS